MMQLDLLAAPSARRFDPETSRDAAEFARDLAARHHRIILDALSRGPAGKDRIAALTSLSGVQVARRTCELHRAGRIEPTGRTVASTAGRQEREWRVVAA